MQLETIHESSCYFKNKRIFYFKSAYITYSETCTYHHLQEKYEDNYYFTLQIMKNYMIKFYQNSNTPILVSIIILKGIQTKMQKI